MDSQILRFCNVVLMQDCQNFEDFSGRDVDTFYISNTNFVNFKKNKDVILNQRDSGLYRFYINSKETLYPKGADGIFRLGTYCRGIPILPYHFTLKQPLNKSLSLNTR